MRVNADSLLIRAAATLDIRDFECFDNGPDHGKQQQQQLSWICLSVLVAISEY